MKHLVLILFAALAVGQAPRSNTDPLVRGKQIVDDAVEALGGEKFLTVQNRIEWGRAYSFYFEELSGASVAKFYTRYIPVDAAKTGTMLAQQEHQAIGKDELFFVVFREEGGWEVTYRGPKPLPKEQLARHRDSTMHNIFYILRNRLHEPGMIFEAKGSDVIDNTPVNVVDVIDSINRVVTVYFHPTTKLPVRQDWIWRDPETRERNVEVTRFSRYREADGTQWPFQMHRERNGRKTYEMFADTVEINREINPKRFAIPAADTRPFTQK